jgi:hypothetical protein
MEPEHSLPCAQELAICPYPEPDQSSAHPFVLIHNRPRTPISKSLNYMSNAEAAVMGGSLVLVTAARLFIEFNSGETSRPAAICFVLGSICFKSDVLYGFPLFHVGCCLQFFFVSSFH